MDGLHFGTLFVVRMKFDGRAARAGAPTAIDASRDRSIGKTEIGHGAFLLLHADGVVLVVSSPFSSRPEPHQPHERASLT